MGANKKSSAFIECTIALVACLFGCAQTPETKNQIAEPEKQLIYESPQYNASDISEKSPYQYAYSQLSEREKRLYEKLLHIMTIYGGETRLEATDQNHLEKVFQCVLNDHPEIFYVSGYTSGSYINQDGKLKYITFAPNYTMQENEIKEKKNILESKRTEILSKLSQDFSEYDKVKYIYDYIIKNTEYDLNAPDNQNICSVLINGKSVCQGYAKTIQYLLNEAGVNTTLITGTVRSGEGHAWNMVIIEGNYYFVDATLGDSSYYLTSRQEYINYDYLCITTKQLLLDHSIQNIVSVPLCVCSDNNYYEKEGLVFDTNNMEYMEEVLKKSLSDATHYIVIKFQNETAYAEAKNKLIDQKKVFQILNSEKKEIAYSLDEARMTISFWFTES